MDSGEESTLREVGGDDVLDLLGVSDDDGNMDDFDEALLAEYEDGEDSTPGAADSAPVTSPAHDETGGNTRAPHAEEAAERASGADSATALEEGEQGAGTEGGRGSWAGDAAAGAGSGQEALEEGEDPESAPPADMLPAGLLDDGEYEEEGDDSDSEEGGRGRFCRERGAERGNSAERNGAEGQHLKRGIQARQG